MLSTQTLLSINALKKYFPLPKRSLFQKDRPYLRAVDGVSLDIRRGETFGLVGESGCGKSTLGRTLLQLYKPTSGNIFYYGRTQTQGTGIDLTHLSAKEMRPLRRDLQIIFQDPYSSLDPRMTVGQLIAEGVATHKLYRRGTREMQEYVQTVMENCGLQPHMLHRYPHQFSGGQRQRISIARALAVQPQFIVCDECVSALDVSVQSQILNLLSDLKEKQGLTYLFISHDLSVVRHISDRIAVMYLGRIVETGSAKEVFDEPRHPYTVALISAIPSTSPTAKVQKKILLSGSMSQATGKMEGCPFAPRCFMAQEICKRGDVPMIEVSQGHYAACHFAYKTAEEKRVIAQNGK